MAQKGPEACSERFSPAAVLHRELTSLLLDPTCAEQRPDGFYAEVTLPDGRNARYSTYFHYLHRETPGCASEAIDRRLLEAGSAIITLEISDPHDTTASPESWWILRPGDLSPETGWGADLAEALHAYREDEFMAFSLHFDGGPQITPIEDPAAIIRQAA